MSVASCWLLLPEARRGLSDVASSASNHGVGPDDDAFLDDGAVGISSGGGSHSIVAAALVLVGKSLPKAAAGIACVLLLFHGLALVLRPGAPSAFRGAANIELNVFTFYLVHVREAEAFHESGEGFELLPLAGFLNADLA